MKRKIFALLCVTFLLVGCGNTQMQEEVANKDKVQESEEDDFDLIESIEEEVSVDENADKGEELMTYDTGAADENGAGSEMDKSARLAYRAILVEAPAIEQEQAQEDLMDASFGYEQNLERFGNHYDYFALVDIDQDGISELLASTIINFRWTPISVFTYADGEVTLLKDPLDEFAHNTFEQNSAANGAYYIYVCEKNHIHNVWKGTNPIGDEVEENYAYVLENGTLTWTDCVGGETENTIYFSDVAQPNTIENVDAIMAE